MRSIQRYILAASTLLTLAAAAAMLLGSLLGINHETEEVFDASLLQSARILQALLPQDAAQSPLHAAEPAPRLPLGLDEATALALAARLSDSHAPAHHYESTQAFLVLAHDGRLLMAVPADFSLPLPERPGFQHQRSNGYDWRSYNLWDERREIWIISAQLEDVRRELSLEITARVVPPLLLVILLLLLAIAWATRRGLRPLRQIGHELDRRQANDLFPLADSELPQELRSPVRALNAMFNRVAATLERERRFTDDAAHELRTPLAAMRAHLARLPAEDAATAALQQGLDRMERIVTQLLQLARLEPHQRRQVSFARLDLADACAEVIAELYPQARARRMQIELQAERPCPLRGDIILLQVLIRNLLENAIRYSHPGDCIQVRLAHPSHRVLLQTIDHGPGLDETEKRKVCERFYRSHKGDSLGAGLGLAIVASVVNLHRGELLLQDTPGSGLTVRIELPEA